MKLTPDRAYAGDLFEAISLDLATLERVARVLGDRIGVVLEADYEQTGVELRGLAAGLGDDLRQLSVRLQQEADAARKPAVISKLSAGAQSSSSVRPAGVAGRPRARSQVH